jgi:ligand-binding sensor domain-containing protein
MSAPVWALDPGKAITQFKQDSWDTERGLPSNQVNAILQTHDGNLWVATSGGLARFNGSSFTVFNKENTDGFPANDVWALLEDRNDVLWVGTNEGLVRYEQGRFSVVARNDPFVSLAEDAEGVLWAASWDFIRRVEGSRVSEVACARRLAGGR